MRGVFVWVHRYVGLLMAGILIVAGLTGSLLAFYDEIEAAANPDLVCVQPPAPDRPLLHPLVLRETVEEQLPRVQVHYVPLNLRPERAAILYVTAALGSAHDGTAESVNDEYFVNPYTGEILGARKWGEIRQGTRNLMPFIYRLHYSLALGTVGIYLFGIVALLWTFDCFIGLYLTFPLRANRPTRSAAVSRWSSRWWAAWHVRRGSPFKLLFTWHRASGLWIWPMLLVFALSAVELNLNEVYHPVMKTLFGMERRVHETLSILDSPQPDPQLSWREAHRIGKRLMKQQADKYQFQILEERSLNYYAKYGLFQYEVRSSLDVSQRYPRTSVWFDGDAAERVAFEAPTGQNTGRTITTWLYNLHLAAAWGLPYRIFVCANGVLVAILSVTGVYIWWKKRRARHHRRSKQKGSPAATRSVAAAQR